MKCLVYFVSVFVFGYLVYEADCTVARYLMPILGTRVPKWLYGEKTTTSPELTTTSSTTITESTTTTSTTETTSSTTSSTITSSSTTASTSTSTAPSTTTTPSTTTSTPSTMTSTQTTTTSSSTTSTSTTTTVPTTTTMTTTPSTTVLSTTTLPTTTSPPPTTTSTMSTTVELTNETKATRTTLLTTPITTSSTTTTTSTTQPSTTTTLPTTTQPSTSLSTRISSAYTFKIHSLNLPTIKQEFLDWRGTLVTNEKGSSELNDAEPVTQTPMGAIRGLWMKTRRGRRFQAYRGIRYALPPVGELRFQPPKPIQAYAGEVDARDEGPACPAPTKPRPTIRRDEDCLCINVYTPDNDVTRRLPVLVFIHGGGFYSLSGRSDQAGPYYLLDRDVVLVTFNYRLGTLGFLSTGDELAPGNNGFKDQVVALRWVQRNIRAFGGDPGLVTLMGCSAGGISVMLHLISPMSKDLFHRAISMSGSPLGKAPLTHELLELTVRQAQLVNCTTDTAREMIDCLKRVPWRRFESSIRGFFKFGYDPISLWKPVVEPYFGQERFITEQPTDLIQEGRIHPVPVIIGQTSHELYWKAYAILRNSTLMKVMDEKWDVVAPIALLVPDGEPTKLHRLRRAYLQDRPLSADEITADALGKLYADAIVAFPVHRLANLLCRYSSHPVYYYEFAYTGQRSYYREPDKKGPHMSLTLGADKPHASQQDDLIYLFTNIGFPPIEPNTRDSDLVDKMTAFFYNFARFGDPNMRSDTPELLGVQWPVMRPDTREYLRIDKQISVDRNMKEERFQVWEDLYPINARSGKYYVLLEDKTESTTQQTTVRPRMRVKTIRKLFNKKTMEEIIPNNKKVKLF